MLKFFFYFFIRLKINTLDVDKILKFYLLEIKKKTIIKEKRIKILLLKTK